MLAERQLLIEKGANTKENNHNLLRVVYVEGKYTWVCRLDKHSWPERFFSSYLEKEIYDPDGNYEFAESDPYPFEVKEDNAKTKKGRKLNDKRYETIEQIVSPGKDSKYRLLFTSQRVRVLVEQAELTGVSRQCVWNLMLIWWKRGMSYSALFPDYQKCGGVKRRKTRGKVKLGAPRTISPGVGINTTDEVERHLQIGADLYLNGKSLPYAYREVVRMFYAPNGEVEDARPTPRQLQRYIYHKYSVVEIKRRRLGQNYWDLNEREILSSASGEVTGPGERCQVDATVADVFLRSQYDLRRIVGRPVVYFALDVFSSLIMAFYAGFEGPSWIGAMMVLVNMVTPKPLFCAKYGVEISEEDWPSRHLPRTILADRGELMSVNLGHNIVKNLCQIENTTARRGDLKGMVENRFGTVPAKFKEYRTGWIEQKFEDRRARHGGDPRLDAILTLPDFTRLLILAVLDHNMTPIKNKRIPAEMITEGLIPSPLQIWKWGIENRSGLLRTASIDEVALNVMPVGFATVTEHGLLFKGACYTSPTVAAEEWFARARHGRWDVPVSFDPRDIGVVYVTDSHFPNGYEKCTLLPDFADHDGRSIYETEELDLDNRRNIAAAEKQTLEHQIQLSTQAHEVYIAARKAAMEVRDPTESKARQTRDVRKNRSEEKTRNREVEALRLGQGDVDMVQEIDTADSAPALIVPAGTPSHDALAYLEGLSKQRR